MENIQRHNLLKWPRSSPSQRLAVVARNEDFSPWRCMSRLSWADWSTEGFSSEFSRAAGGAGSHI